MANIKSAKKRVLIAQRNTERNVAFKTSIKTAVKKDLACAASEDKAELKNDDFYYFKLTNTGVKEDSPIIKKIKEKYPNLRVEVK